MDAPVVAVLNTSEDTTDMLRTVLELQGWVVVTAFTNQLRAGTVDFGQFIRLHRPRVIVYDIAPPYEQNWRLFQHFRNIAIPHDIGLDPIWWTLSERRIRCPRWLERPENDDRVGPSLTSSKSKQRG